MELIKRNIHMDCIRTEAVTQITLEDDMNIPENKPDVDVINMDKGQIVIEEVRAGTDVVNVRGKLVYHILYRTSEKGRSLVAIEGKIPFEERIHLRGATAQDTVTVDGKVEDLSVGIINSRKLSLQAVVTLLAQVESLCDEEVPIGIHGDSAVEYRKMPLEIAQIVISKKDILRLKDEVALPANAPNIYQILWDTVSLRDMEFKALNEKLSIQGDAHVFILYEGEGEERPVRSFETSLPINSVLECHGCREGMLPDIRYGIGQKELTVRPDFDGEERNVGLEMVLDIGIKIYEEERLEVLSDIYGVSKEVETVARKANLRRLLSRVTGKTKVAEHVKAGGGAPVLQLLHSEGQVMPEHQTVVENGILLQGSLIVKVMYITGNDELPYVSTEVMLPYEYTLDVPGITPADMGKVYAGLEQMQVNMLDGEELDVRAVLTFGTTVFQNIPVQLIYQANVSDIDSGKLANLPGMVIYMVCPGDNLWNIGKKYYVPTEALRQLNNLQSDELKAGQKLLIVK